jgi:hypothetical protein
MRHFVLALTLSLLASAAAVAADSEAVAKDATEFAKRIALATQAAKDKAGQYPSAVKVWAHGKEIEVKVQVTPLAEGYSIKAIPAVDARGAAPMQNASIDVNNGPGGAAIVSLVGTAPDGSDVVAFATTGTELAVTITQGDQTVTVNGTTSLADVPAQTPPATATTAPAATSPASTTATKPPAPTPAAPAPAPAAPVVAAKPPAPAPAPAPAPVTPSPSQPETPVAKAPTVPAVNTAPKSPSAPAAVSTSSTSEPPQALAGGRPRDRVLRATIALAEQPIELSDGATPIQRAGPSIPR